MFMREIAEKKAANYSTLVAQKKYSSQNIAAIKENFHLRALIKSVAK